MIRCFQFITAFWLTSSAEEVGRIWKNLGLLEFGCGRRMVLTEMGCCGVKSKRVDGGNGEEEELGFGSVKLSRGLGRKRIVISSGRNLLRRQFGGVIVPDLDQSPVPESPAKTPLKRQRSGAIVPNSDKSLLESLPQDLLIRVLCGADHEDLEKLFFVSKAIREAALIAKQSHFAYSTPKKTPAFRNPIDFNEIQCDLDEVEPPNAPIRAMTYREPWTKTKRKDLSSISMALFT